MQDDVLRRLARLEESDDKMREALQQLIVSTARLNEIVEQHNYLIPTVRRLETQAMNNSLVVSAVKWATVTFLGSAITITMGLFMKGLL
jgi:histidinol dehydrogenase